jgi:ferredoxin
MTELIAVVDRETCMGIAMCRSVSPDAFRLEDGKSVFVPGPDVTDDDVLEAAENCPVEAIRVLRATGD